MENRGGQITQSDVFWKTDSSEFFPNCYQGQQRNQFISRNIYGQSLYTHPDFTQQLNRDINNSYNPYFQTNYSYLQNIHSVTNNANGTRVSQFIQSRSYFCGPNTVKQDSDIQTINQKKPVHKNETFSKNDNLLDLQMLRLVGEDEIKKDNNDLATTNQARDTANQQFDTFPTPCFSNRPSVSKPKKETEDVVDPTVEVLISNIEETNLDTDFGTPEVRIHTSLTSTGTLIDQTEPSTSATPWQSCSEY